MTDGEKHGFDKISFELGQNAKGLETLNRLFEQHCDDDDRRHKENVGLLADNTKALNDLAARLAPVAANYALTKRRLALVASIGLGILIMVSWAAEAGLKWAVGWVLKIKFGG